MKLVKRHDGCDDEGQGDFKSHDMVGQSRPHPRNTSHHSSVMQAPIFNAYIDELKPLL